MLEYKIQIKLLVLNLWGLVCCVTVQVRWWWCVFRPRSIEAQYHKLQYSAVCRHNTTLLGWWHNTHITRKLLIQVNLTKITVPIIFTYIPCISILSELYLPTDAQLNCLKKHFQIYIKIDIKTAPKYFGVISIIRERTIWSC
jgi:hypothetical protein